MAPFSINKWSPFQLTKTRLAAIPGKKHTYQVTVTSMADERLAPLYERWRRAEMYQAAHRV
ncbi:MAG: hypothetical protein KGY78_10485, partial [Anaerolineae bacterium]|nr:hypothetical protein [Anaerolineae bacterium]